MCLWTLVHGGRDVWPPGARVAGSCEPTDVGLGIKLSSSGRVIGVLSYWAISPTPHFILLNHAATLVPTPIPSWVDLSDESYSYWVLWKPPLDTLHRVACWVIKNIKTMRKRGNGGSRKLGDVFRVTHEWGQTLAVPGCSAGVVTHRL